MGEARGDMFPGVITRNMVRGKCPGECGYCYMRHGKLAKIEAYHKPFHCVTKEFQAKFKPDTVYFLGSATDIWCPEVPTEYQAEIVRRLYESGVPESTWFLFSTKYPDGYMKWLDSLPAHTILSITLETERNIDYRTVSKAPLPAERILSAIVLRKRIDASDRKYKLMINMEPALDFRVNAMRDALQEIQPDFMVFGADTSGWVKKNVIPTEANWVDILHLLECTRSMVGQVLIKKNIWRLAPLHARGSFKKLMREHAEDLDFAIQGDPDCAKQEFFLGDDDEQATTGDLFG